MTAHHLERPVCARHSKAPPSLLADTIRLTVTLGVPTPFGEVFLSLTRLGWCNHLLPASGVPLPTRARTSFTGHLRFSFSGNRSNIKGGYEDASTLYRSSRHSARVAGDYLYRLSTLVFGMIAMPFSPSSANVHTIVNLRMSGT